MHVLRWISILLRRSDTHVLLAVLGGLLAGGALAASPYQISQKNREFQPGYIANRGEALRFINDEGDLLHHAYLPPQRSRSIRTIRSRVVRSPSSFRSPAALRCGAGSIQK